MNKPDNKPSSVEGKEAHSRRKEEAHSDNKKVKEYIYRLNERICCGRKGKIQEKYGLLYPTFSSSFGLVRRIRLKKTRESSRKPKLMAQNVGEGVEVPRACNSWPRRKEG